MRIISQDGEFDLPCEETTIRVFLDGKVIAYSLNDLGNNDFITMAKYSTKEKAMKAMEMCREKYLSRMELDGGIYNDDTCCGALKKWAESEYIEKAVISKKDRAFLDCLKNRWKYMARDGLSDAVYVFSEIPKKDEFGYSYTGEVRRASTDFNVDFPMVKWEDEEPWLIEDLKKLEVVENYE